MLEEHHRQAWLNMAGIAGGPYEIAEGRPDLRGVYATSVSLTFWPPAVTPDEGMALVEGLRTEGTEPGVRLVGWASTDIPTLVWSAVVAYVAQPVVAALVTPTAEMAGSAIRDELLRACQFIREWAKAGTYVVVIEAGDRTVCFKVPSWAGVDDTPWRSMAAEFDRDQSERECRYWIKGRWVTETERRRMQTTTGQATSQ